MSLEKIMKSLLKIVKSLSYVRFSKFYYIKLSQCIKFVQIVMDTTDQNISFDEKGFAIIVKLLQKILPNWKTGDTGNLELETILNKIKKDGKGKDFDCIIGMSGGIDSSYLTM